MDAFRLAAEQRYQNLNAIKTNVHNINVCKSCDLPNLENGFVKKHLETGICFMLHTTKGTVLEVRGIDENQEEFSYRFHYEKGAEQSLAMRAVGASGEVNRLQVSLANENHRDKGMSIHDVKNNTVQTSGGI
ncbi:MAG: hypothetical protein CL857_02450 [Cryomorphaceae bacterium]|nr:hypothetical protein [Cryomorphaceae bacterium]|tara:strand:- start:1330 stop:1725 length:396 start_codon:yes stop_codon:yes gene_type:complete